MPFFSNNQLCNIASFAVPDPLCCDSTTFRPALRLRLFIAFSDFLSQPFRAAFFDTLIVRLRSPTSKPWLASLLAHRENGTGRLHDHLVGRGSREVTRHGRHTLNSPGTQYNQV